MPPEQTELILPEKLAPARAIELLSKRVELSPGRASVADRVLLDSFDGRLRGAGLYAEAVAGELVLFEPGAPVRRAAVPRRARRYLVSELPPGVVRDRVADVLGVRALLPRVRLRSETVPVAVLDGDSKTVVRISIERSSVAGGGETLAPRLLVRPVLGYDKDYERVLRVARDRLGFVPADQSLYDAAVRAVGGRPAGIKSKPKVSLPGDTRTDAAAQQVLHALADIAEANLPGAIDDLDSEFLHDLRTSIRRARSVLRELKGVHPVDVRARVRDELKWAQQLTGPVRDLDVQLLEWDSLAADHDLGALRSLLERRRAAELVRLRRGLRSKRFAAAIAGWREIADTPPPTDEDPDRLHAALPIHAVAGARIRKVYRRMVRDGSAITDASPAEDLHDLRKRGKELRYLLELFGASYPDDVVKPMVSTLKDLQDVLGHFQDRATQSTFLRGLADELAGEPGGPEALIALGSVLDIVEADQRAARAEFAEAFRPFAASSQGKVVSKTFPKRP